DPVGSETRSDWRLLQRNRRLALIGGATARQAPGAVPGHRMSCVQRKSATLRLRPGSLTTASHTCVVLPRCIGVATQASTPSRTVLRKLLLSSTVVKFVAPSGRCARQP